MVYNDSNTEISHFIHDASVTKEVFSVKQREVYGLNVIIICAASKWRGMGRNMNYLPSGDCLHDVIVNELFEMKSLSALIYLINAGRELEFHYKRIEFFITSYNNEENVVLCKDKIESRYKTMDELINNAILVDTPFIEAWKQVVLGTLF